MSDYTTTPNYGLYKPTPNADVDLWGDHLNANADKLDQVIRDIAVASGGGAGGGRDIWITDFLPAGQPDGSTDLASYFQQALDAAAGADPTDRAAAPGVAKLIVPANPLPYIIGTALLIPSHSHIVIEQGATLKIADGANQSMLLVASGASNVLVEMYGTLDGNASMQTFSSTVADLFDFERSGGGASCGFGSLGSCTNIVMDGGGLQGLITNFWHWPVNIVSATNALVRGVRMTNCGNTAEFAGITTRISVTGGSYVGNTGVLTLSTAGTGGGPHGINVGDAFTWVAVPGADPIVYLQGEFVALTVPDAYTVTCNAGIGNAPSIPSGSFPAYPNAGRVGTCTRCSNVGFENCYVADIRDIGMCLYSGCTGSYIRNCELERASGPILFCDAGQPASNRDCEISGNYTHGGRGGPGSASNETGCFSFNSQIFDNIAAENLSGCALGGGDGVSFHGNLLHGNIPAVQVSTGYGSQLLIPSVSKTNVFDNTVRDPLPAPARHGVAQLATTAGANTYNSATGIVSLTTATAHNVTVGATFYVQNQFGLNNPTTAYLQLNGKWICLSAPSSTTLTYQGPIGLGTVNLGVAGQVWSNAYPLPVAHIAPGTYTSDATGLLSLTTVEMHGYDTVSFANSAPFVLSSVFGTATVGGLSVPFPLVGLFQAQAGTVNSTLTLITTPNATFVLTAGRVLPPSFGIAIDGPDYCRISGNRIGDYGSPLSLTACIGGTWGTNGSSDGNYFGPRNAVDPDVSLYILGSVNGLNHDLIYSSVLTNSSIAGQVTFLGSTQASAGGLSYYQPQGLTPGWNYNAGRGEVDFLLGEGAGSPGGFDFLQIKVIKIASGTYDPATGNVVLTTDRPHGVQVGGTFVISNLKDSAGGTDVGTLGGGRTATTGTTGTTLTYTVARLGLTVAPITGGQVVPDGAAGGVIKTTVGVAGSLLANDGLGNTRLGGALVHGAMQTATLAAAGTVTVNPNTSFVLVQNASSIATGAVVLPAPQAGSYQLGGAGLEIRFQNAVGALTMTAATGASVAGPPSAVLSGGSSFRFVMTEPGNVWLPCISDISGTPPVGGPYLALSGGAVIGPTTFSGAVTTTGTTTLGAPANVTATGSTTSRSLQDRWGELDSVKDWGATGNGTTDDTAAIQAAIAAVGPGCLRFPSGTYKISSTLTMPSMQRWQGASTGSTIIQWAGGNSTDIITTALPTYMDKGGIESMTIHAGTATGMTLLHLRNVHQSIFRNLHLEANSGAGNICMFLEAGAAGNVGNCCHNAFYHIIGRNCAKGMVLGGPNAGSVATDNAFFFVDFSSTPGLSGWIGIEYQHWCDSNQVYYARLTINGLNGICVLFNSLDPTGTASVYNEVLHGTMCDNIGTITGSIGFKLNSCRGIYVTGAFTSPQPYPGYVTADPTYALSYYIQANNPSISGSASNMPVYQRAFGDHPEPQLQVPGFARTRGRLGAAPIGNANRLYATSIFIANFYTVKTLAIAITAANTSSAWNVRMGIYADNGFGKPGTLVAGTDAGTLTIAMGSLTGETLTLTAPVLLSRGLYWVAVVVDVIGATVLSSGPSGPSDENSSSLNFPASLDGLGNGCWAAFTFGALPATFPTPALTPGIDVPVVVMGF